uniref:Uncharacterized protein n=1 Tax=Ascaris lumbricoides TaxID=6252 RepID=A0A0M3IR92_ASCLU
MTDVLTTNAESVVETSDNRQQFVTSSPCPSDEHPLEFTYVFSYFVRPQGKFDPEDYAAYVQPVASFNSVEQFWNTYRHIRRPSGMFLFLIFMLFVCFIFILF